VAELPTLVAVWFYWKGLFAHMAGEQILGKRSRVVLEGPPDRLANPCGGFFAGGTAAGNMLRGAPPRRNDDFFDPLLAWLPGDGGPRVLRQASLRALSPCPTRFR
jgi:hypothetical protein